jgi:hypothetical protein
MGSDVEIVCTPLHIVIQGISNRHRVLARVLLVQMTELVLDYAGIPLDQVNDPGKQNRGTFIKLGQMLKEETTKG